MNAVLFLVLCCSFQLCAVGYFINIYEIFSLDAQSLDSDPEVNENATEIIKSLGFDAEEHFVETEDGYILCLFRLRNLSRVDSSKVVYLQHGLLDSAHTWINNLRNQSLAFILADDGFDVWLGNSRGSTYSKRHRFLTSDNLSFWQFSWDDMAHYDLPSSLYYVLNHTNVSTLGYIGHSQGCQIAFAQFDQDPVLQSRINSFIALAPVAYLGHVSSPIHFIVPFAHAFDLWDHFGHGEFLPSNVLLRFLAKFLCGKDHVRAVCSNAIFLIAGYDAANTNTSRLPVYVSHTPAGTSARNIVHYCQSMHSDKFQRYDYGANKNIEIYGQKTPPEYDLSNITVPVVIYNGGGDWLAVSRDVNRLADRIRPALVDQFFFQHYNHLDFVWGMDAGRILYPSVVEYLHFYSSQNSGTI